MLIDTHAHLYFEDYSDEERRQVLHRAREAGVEAIINIGGGKGFDGNIEAVELAQQETNVFATVGIHPHDASLVDPALLDRLRPLLKEPKVVAVGEVGLDFYYKNSDPKKQEEVFRQMIALAKEAKLPLSIHDRDAHEAIYRILKEEDGFSTGGVIHCFSGDWDFAKKIIDGGLLISFSGVVTFKNAKDLHEVARRVPTESFVVETDSPFLAPEPHRGKRNEPAFIRHTAERIAEIKGLSLEDVARTSSLNARRLFRLGKTKLEPKIAYKIRNSLYLNITNICTLACVFCPKFSTFEVKGYSLRLPKAPEFNEVVEALRDVSGVHEVVFCGFGEPTQRLDLLKQVADYIHSKGIQVRLDTDGLGNLIHKRNIAPELQGYIDSISVSLNAHDAATYAKVCPSRYGEAAYSAVKEFIGEVKKYIPNVTASVVGLPGLDVDKCRRIVEEELGVRFRLREYQHVG